MTEWLWELWESLTIWKVLAGAGIFLLSLAFSFASLAVVMVKLPVNYFSSHYVHDFLPGSSFLVRWGAVIAKNLFGVFLVLLGIALSLPGVPGQGVLTILLGIIMLDIPGKRPIEAKIIRRPAVRSAVDSLRARFNRPPFELD